MYAVQPFSAADEVMEAEIEELGLGEEGVWYGSQ
jgi:hypothetical protein